ncbi:MAG: hypothetical protein KJ623_03020 [Nanoarchaeota archaeon]|nr:hypothetical protein [Nanoarchaeota archaeon]MBU0962388.1 hypothetical protein [Nanoarchaeota archaeon]
MLNNIYNCRIKNNFLEIPANFIGYFRDRNIYIKKSEDTKFIHLIVTYDTSKGSNFITRLKNDRIHLINPLIEYAGLEDIVTINGIINQFNIWNPDVFKKYYEESIRNHYNNGIVVGSERRKLNPISASH